jgi:hypothetical protein
VDIASLNNGQTGIGVCDGDFKAVRAWVDGNSVRLLIAGFNTGGADVFYAKHYAAERRPLKMGDQVRGKFKLFVCGTK